MITVDSLPKDLVRDLAGRDLVVFDGECVLCSWVFQFLLRHDKDRRFSFVVAQSDLGGALYEALEMSKTDFETVLVFYGGKVHTHLNGFAAMMHALGGAWSVLSVCRYLPRFIKDPLYYVIARNRYRIFGRFDTCMIPDASVRARFLDVYEAKTAL